MVPHSWIQPPAVLALILYLVAAAYFVFGLGRGAGSALVRGRQLMIAALVVHTLTIITAALVARRDPFGTRGEAAVFFLWALVLIYLLADRENRFPALGAFVAPFPVIVLALAYWLSPSLQRPVAHILRSHWRTIHVPLALVGYATFVLAFCVSLAYLVQDWLLKAKRLTGISTRLPSLEAAEALGYRLVGLGFVLLTLAAMTGAIWAQRAWSVHWSLDPMVGVVILTWIVYGVYLHARRVSGWRGRRVNVFLVLGFVCVVFSYVAAFLFPSTQHRF